MGFPINIEKLIAGNIIESDRMEFKKGWNPQSIIHSMCAFANDYHNLGGGYIFIGIEEKNGKAILPPIGIDEDEIDNIQKELLNLCHQIVPNYFPIVEPYKIGDKYILVIGLLQEIRLHIKLLKHSLIKKIKFTIFVKCLQLFKQMKMKSEE